MKCKRAYLIQALSDADVVLLLLLLGEVESDYLVVWLEERVAVKYQTQYRLEALGGSEGLVKRRGKVNTVHSMIPKAEPLLNWS